VVKISQRVVKLSGIPSHSVYPHRQIAPTIKQIVEEFGPDRLMYGGGFGPDATGDSYREVIKRCQSFITDLSTEDQAKILGNNAASIMGFDI